ncbi:PREDICTED: mucin-22-like [Rhagoletis zephyria]|uniref:mucin-22-like n=1 Tax=Rhagoletis zephyria TaxID=28612 RepID=UPI00081161E7|nr:PREDICTED: mucin-22-like [Rhagoletis zephyria]
MKYTVIILLIGFVLLLILSNVDFADESYEWTTAVSTIQSEEVSVSTPNAAASTTITSTTITTTAIDNSTTMKIINDSSTAGVNISERAVNAVSAYTGFTCTDNRTCKSIICSGGPIYTLIYELEYFIDYCGNKNFDVILENCTFNDAAIGKYTMSGSYKLNSLTIRNCTLEAIVNSAFNYVTMQNLVNLTLHGTQLQTLNAKSFEGLGTVNHFELLNVQHNETTPLKVENFLQPMAGNLSSLVLQQSQVACGSHIIYDPAQWLDSSTAFVNLLIVNLSGTEFNRTLNGSTFSNLLAVEQLSLAQCSLHTIGEGTFDCILKTLRSLDLRDNLLQTLDGDFLVAAATAGISIQLGENKWRCECDNQALIEYVAQAQEANSELTKCSSPNELAGKPILHLQLDCNATTIKTTTASSTKDATTTVSSTKDATTTVSSTKDATATSPTATTSHNSTESTETTDTTIREKTTKTTLPTTATYTTTRKQSDTDTTTTRLQTTTIGPGFQVCPSSALPKFIYCEIEGLVVLCDYDAYFDVEAISSTSVQLEFDVEAYGLRVIYFQAMIYNDTYSVLIETNNSLVINYLTSNEMYVFCIMKTSSLTTSPFNCGSVYLPLVKAVPWLMNEDKALFYTLSTIITIICCLLGIAVCYWILRCRPTLIRGNKRIRRVASTSYKVMLFAKPFDRLSFDSTQLALHELSKMRSSISDTLTAENYLSVDSRDYMQYLKGLELNREAKVIYISDNRPPFNRAPTLPPPQADRKCCSERRRDCNSEALSHQSSQCSTVLMKGDPQPSARFLVWEQNATLGSSENVYESLDYYQELH